MTKIEVKKIVKAISKKYGEDSIVQYYGAIPAEHRQKNIEKFHLLGHSMGGMIAQEMVKISGDKINKLTCRQMLMHKRTQFNEVD